MKRNLRKQRIIIVIMVMPVIFGIMAFTNFINKPDDAKLEKEYQELLNKGNYKDFIKRLSTTYISEKFSAEIEAAGKAIASNVNKGMTFIDKLNEQKDLISRSIQAELLMRTSGSIGLPYKKNTVNQVETVAAGQIASRAIKLLNDEDPFVRGLAEFAISIQVGLENSGSLREFPGETKPDWYKIWEQTIEGDAIIAMDYTRQASELGLHRTSELLGNDALKITERAEGVLSMIRENGDQQKVIQAEKTYNELKKMAESLQGTQDLKDARLKYIALRKKARDLIMLNPDIDFSQVVFSLNHSFHKGGNITNGGRSFAIKPGGDIFIKKSLNPSGEMKGLITATLGPGHTRGMELNFDAQKVLFSFAPQPEYYQVQIWESDQGFNDAVSGLSVPNNIYEVDLQGNVKQITSDPLYIDIEPTYLPNGDIVFSSDRGEFGSQCSGSYFQNKRILNRYRMSADGNNVRAISNNKDFDRYNHVLDNGQLIYTRWEYQERHLYYVHNLWVSKPDGSMADAIYKEHINAQAPMALRDARQIYGTDKLVAIGCGHHEWEQGAIILIDPKIGTNDPDGMTILTPSVSEREGGIGKGKIPDSGGIPDNGGLYQQPFALSETSFLVAFSYNYPRTSGHGFNFGLYYIDVYGNKELIHRDPVLSVWYPVPLKQRQVPPVVPDSYGGVDYATIYMTNVYQGMEEVEQGEIKHIRIAHHTEWPAAQIDDQPHNYNHLHYTPSGSWSRTLGMSTWSPARVIGVVPVEEDGSAYFKVPSDVPVYFQALDENMTEVRRMRSFITFGRGETRGCTGCHETRDEAPLALNHVPRALLREPSQPKPPSWGDTTLPDYEDHIHQIFANNCNSCHGVNNPAGGLEFSSRRVDGYYQAYRTLFGLDATDPTPVEELKAFLLTFGEEHNVVEDKESLIMMEENRYPGQLITISNKFSDASVTKVREFGSGNSKITRVLLSKSHQEHVKLSEKDWEDLVTWIDLNAPYWGSFFDKEPVREGGIPKKVKVTFDPPFVEK